MQCGWEDNCNLAGTNDNLAKLTAYAVTFSASAMTLLVRHH